MRLEHALRGFHRDHPACVDDQVRVFHMSFMP
jgi:hypothetical protein